MSGLPTNLYMRCRTVLSKCAELESNAMLRAVFVTEELAPFKGGLHEAASKNERIDICLDYLLPKQLRDGRHTFHVFLETLRDRYPEGDLLRNELDLLARDVMSVLSPTDRVPPTSNPAPQHPTVTGGTKGGPLPGRKDSTVFPSSPGNTQPPFDKSAFVIKMAEALLECACMSNRGSRETVVGLLPTHMKTKISEKSSAYDDVVEILNTCLDFADGMEKLMEIMRHRENGAICMRNVEKTMKDYRS